jgi:1-acyl-sn-glycerol-3-phosphate acyltransferase
LKLAWFVFVGFVRLVGGILVRLDATDLERLPRKGPLILAMNHVNFLDGPLFLARIFPRRTASLAKKETWNNPFMGFFASAAGCIPLDRDMSDPTALRKASRALETGGFLLINPEGTRSRDGVLRRGKPGVVSIAIATGAPVVPLAFEGLEDFRSNRRRLRRTPARLHMGEPFVVSAPGEGEGRETRGETLDEIMMRIAALLPESKRGEYAGRNLVEPRRTRTIAFDP